MTTSDPPAPFSGEQITGMVRSVSKLYVLAVLDEITTATARYQADIAAIRHKYLTELGGEDPFALLLAESQRPEWWRSGVRSGVNSVRVRLTADAARTPHATGEDPETGL